MTKKVFLILLALVLAISIGIMGCTAPAEEEEEEEPEVITLKFGTYFPEMHFLTQEVTVPWQNKITAETDGVIQWENYCGTLVSPGNTYAEIQSGLVDVGMVAATYESTGFDIMQNWPTFFTGAQSMECEVAVFQEIVTMFPEIKAEFSEVKLLDNGYPATQYNLMTADTPVYTIEDFAGLQLKCMADHADTLATFGASGVVMSMFEVYTSIETGVLDGLIGQDDALETLNLADLINYHTTVNLPYGPGYVYGMNWDTWNNLPEDIQQVFEDNRDFITDTLVSEWNEKRDSGIAYGALQGVEFIELPPEELEELYDLLRQTAQEGVDTLDGLGFPGTEIYEEIQQLIVEYQA